MLRCEAYAASPTDAEASLKRDILQKQLSYTEESPKDNCYYMMGNL
jgi:hypothetical protein